jgi:uncharacterized membrane protein/mono/diheme cytochrome c family protein
VLGRGVRGTRGGCSVSPQPMIKAFFVGLALLVVLITAAAPARATEGDPARGGALLAKKGCTSCHSTDGTQRSGPTLQGLFGSRRSVSTAGKTHDVVADDAYIARSLRDPDADVVVGFPRGTMPKFDLDDRDASSIARAIEALGDPFSPPPVKPEAEHSRAALGWLAFYALWFVGLHLLLSSIPVRTKIIGKLGQRRFGILYSAAAAIGLLGMVFSFRGSSYVEVWLPARGLRWVPVLAMPIAILFMVSGFSTKSPTTVGQGDVAKEEEGPRGILTVTRHPALWGFALWAIAHLATNGELRAIIVFVAIFVLSIAGMVHIDRRRAAALGADWARYRERTSLVPFAAILRGKIAFDWRGIGLARVLGSAFTYVAILHTHALLIGASPMP